MGEEKIWSEMNQMKTDISSIRTDVTDIKDALLGDKYGNRGYSDRIETLEDNCEIVQKEINSQRNFRKLVKLAAISVGSITAGVLAFIEFIHPLLNN